MRTLIILSLTSLSSGCVSMNSYSYDLGPRTEVVVNYNYSLSGFGPGNDATQNSSPKEENVTNQSGANQPHEVSIAPFPKMKLSGKK